MNTSTQANRATPAKTKKLKQAVVVIHGIGEQRPMETIRSFVRNVWMKDNHLENPHFWNKPSSVSRSFEQRKLTTNSPKTKDGDDVTRTDFYEYYWAYKTVGTKWEHFTGWIRQLLFCRPTGYGKHTKKLLPVWLLLWAMFIIALGLVGGWVGWVVPRFEEQTLASALITGAEVAILFFLNKARTVITQYFGDVARYVEAKPANIRIRQSIREGGIELLERIQQTGEYDRVILVGHSLGSIVAYDILNHLWGRHYKFNYQQDGITHTRGLSASAIELADKLKTEAQKIGTPDFNQTQYRKIQSELFENLREHDCANNWLISDFITLGSPLTYADLILFEDDEKFTLRKLDREYPTSPPIEESGRYYFQCEENVFLHHGAVFAPVQWTNLYSPSSFIIKGDIISGPVSPNFSFKEQLKDHLTPVSDEHTTPILEIAIAPEEMGGGFTHTNYWKGKDKDDTNEIPLAQLRRALKLY